MFLAIVITICSILIIFLLTIIFLAISAKRWNSVEGSIISIDEKRTSLPTKQIGAPIVVLIYSPLVKYEYSVHGKSYTGTRISFSPHEQGYYDRETVNKELGLKVGDKINVYYNKYFHRLSVLKPNEPDIMSYIVVIALLIVVVAAVCYANNMIN